MIPLTIHGSILRNGVAKFSDAVDCGNEWVELSHKITVDERTNDPHVAVRVDDKALDHIVLVDEPDLIA